MKILFIHNYYKQSGGEDVAVQLEMDILKQNGHIAEALYFVNDNIEGITGKLRGGINSFYNRNSRKKAREIIDNFKPDIIHVHNLFFQASPSVLFIAHERKVPVVMTLHNYRLICANAMLLKDNKPCIECVHHKLPFSGIRNACYRNSRLESALTTAVTSMHKFTGCWSKNVSKYIALTQFAKDIFINSALNIDEEQIIVKPNFVIDNGEGPENREEFFLFVGRLSQEKGIIQLLEAFAQMPLHKLIIAGEGPLENLLRQEYELNTNISFLGKKTRTEILSLMKRAKALIFPSIWYEGLPYTIIEAFSTGTPVLATNLGAMSQMIVDDYNGFLFKPNSSSEIVRMINQFNFNTNKELYTNARKSYLEHYHPDKHYASTIGLYESLINNERKILNA